MILFWLLAVLTPEGLKHYINRRLHTKYFSVPKESKALRNERWNFFQNSMIKIPVKRIPFL
jgi:hypothetical protein